MLNPATRMQLRRSADLYPGLAVNTRNIGEIVAGAKLRQVKPLVRYDLTAVLDKDEREASWEQYSSMTPEQRSVLRANGWTSNTAARHAGAPTGLAKQAARPLAATVQPTVSRPGKPTKPPREAPAGTITVAPPPRKN